MAAFEIPAMPKIRYLVRSWELSTGDTTPSSFPQLPLGVVQIFIATVCLSKIYFVRALREMHV